MANHKSAAKRARQTEKRQMRNRRIKSTMRTVVKGARADLASDEKLHQAEAVLRRAASKGVIPKRRASRHVSRLAKAANRSSSSS